MLEYLYGGLDLKGYDTKARIYMHGGPLLKLHFFEQPSCW